jgi:hypothetical protein
MNGSNAMASTIPGNISLKTSVMLKSNGNFMSPRSQRSLPVSPGPWGPEGEGAGKPGIGLGSGVC